MIEYEHLDARIQKTEVKHGEGRTKGQPGRP